jgi:hypothetical protein
LLLFQAPYYKGTHDIAPHILILDTRGISVISFTVAALSLEYLSHRRFTAPRASLVTGPTGNQQLALLV